MTHFTISINPHTHLTEEEVYAECRTVVESGDMEISDSAMVTIASWWESSGTVGSEFARLASTYRADLDALLEDIYYTRRDTTNVVEHRALDCMATAAINHVSRTAERR